MAEDPSAKAWTDHLTQQRRAWLALSYAERLRWLEDAKRFYAIALGAARRKRRPGTAG
jgi:hypothetical protein